MQMGKFDESLTRLCWFGNGPRLSPVQMITALDAAAHPSETQNRAHAAMMHNAASIILALLVINGMPGSE
jgi:hypothetical protein